MALVVQLVETPGLNPAQYGFESHRGHHLVGFPNVEMNFVAPQEPWLKWGIEPGKAR